MIHLWAKWYVKAAMSVVVVIALLVAVVAFLVAVWPVAPTYTADQVTKKMQTYLRGKVYKPSQSRYFPDLKRTEYLEAVSCYTRVLGLKGLAIPHYIPNRKAWLITTVSSSGYTWLFDERTGTIASSDGRC